RTYAEERERHERDVAWWADALEGAPERMPLPFERGTPDPTATPADGAFLFGLDPELSRQLEALRRSEGATFFMVRVAAFAAQLAAENDSGELAIGTYATTRRVAETHDMFGFFSNLVTLRLRFDGNPSFRDWLGTVREAV